MIQLLSFIEKNVSPQTTKIKLQIYLLITIILCFSTVSQNNKKPQLTESNSNYTEVIILFRHRSTQTVCVAMGFFFLIF